MKKAIYMGIMAVVGIGSHIAVAYLYDWKLSILIFLMLWSNNASLNEYLKKKK